MKLLLLGSAGQVGWELQRSLAPLGEVVACDRSTADLENLPQLEAAIAAAAPDVVVNAAAYTAVDKAESEPDRAAAINTAAVSRMAELAKRGKFMLVHYSTDYVFDGGGDGAYLETDAADPHSVYGRTKRDGEQAIGASGCRHLIFRTCWVHAPRGANFIKTVLRLAREREELRIVADQVGAPTSAELIADVTAHAVRGAMSAPDDLSDTYHLAASGETSWHGLARFVVERAIAHGVALKATPDGVRAIATSDYPTPAKRPANSRLDTSRLRTTFGLTLPRWEEGAGRTIAELLS